MADVANPHDLFFKDLFTRLEVAREFLMRYLPPEIVAIVDWDTLELAKDSFIGADLETHFSDLLYRVRLKGGRVAYLYLLFEHKSSPDEWVAFQILGYKVELWRQARQQGAKKLPPVFPLVVYHGKRHWKVARNFLALMELGGRAEFHRYEPEFDYHLFDVSGYDEHAAAGQEALLRLGLSALKYAFDKDLGPQMADFFQFFRELPEAAALEYLETMLRYVTTRKQVKTQHLETAVQAGFPKRGAGNMQNIVDKWINKGVRQGLKEGRQEGFAEYTLLLLNERFGAITEEVESRIRRLPPKQLGKLGVASFKFDKLDDVEAWLRKLEDAQQRTH